MGWASALDKTIGKIETGFNKGWSAAKAAKNSRVASAIRSDLGSLNKGMSYGGVLGVAGPVAGGAAGLGYSYMSDDDHGIRDTMAGAALGYGAVLGGRFISGGGAGAIKGIAKNRYGQARNYAGSLRSRLASAAKSEFDVAHMAGAAGGI